jgi:hypothetical protein
MATFGETSNGTSAQAYSADRKLVSSATPASNGFITAGTARMWTTTTAVNVPVKMVIYNSTAGEPDQLLATSDASSFNSNTEVAVNFTFSGNNQIGISADTPYWIGVIYDYTTVAVNVSRANTAGLVRSNNDTYSDGATTTFGATTTTNGALDVYVTYTETELLGSVSC